MSVDINGTTGVTTPGLASTAMPTSGGDPVVESGSNSDGEWTKWANGTQICRVFNLTLPLDSVSGISWTFPSAFVGSANAKASRGTGASESNAVSVIEQTQYGWPHDTAVPFFVMKLDGTRWGTSGTIGQLMIEAIGLWK